MPQQTVGSRPAAPQAPAPWRTRVRRFRRRVRARRRWLGAAAALAAVAFTIAALRPASPETTSLLVAAHDLSAGTLVEAGDLKEIRVPSAAAPDGLLAEPVGERLLAPVRAGEAITDLRIVGTDLRSGYPGRVRLAVRISDPGVAALLRSGDQVDLLSVDPETGETERVASDALVIRPAAQGDSSLSGAAGAIVVIAVDPTAVGDTLEASVRKYVTVEWNG